MILVLTHREQFLQELDPAGWATAEAYVMEMPNTKRQKTRQAAPDPLPGDVRLEKGMTFLDQRIACEKVKCDDDIGINWGFFDKDVAKAEEAAFKLIDSSSVAGAYVGVAWSPYKRMRETPWRHDLCFNALYPMTACWDAGKVEQRWIRRLKYTMGAKNLYIGKGHERVCDAALNFLSN